MYQDIVGFIVINKIAAISIAVGREYLINNEFQFEIGNEGKAIDGNLRVPFVVISYLDIIVRSEADIERDIIDNAEKIRVIIAIKIRIIYSREMKVRIISA